MDIIVCCFLGIVIILYLVRIKKDLSFIKREIKYKINSGRFRYEYDFGIIKKDIEIYVQQQMPSFSISDYVFQFKKGEVWFCESKTYVLSYDYHIFVMHGIQNTDVYFESINMIGDVIIYELKQ